MSGPSNRARVAPVRRPISLDDAIVRAASAHFDPNLTKRQRLEAGERLLRLKAVRAWRNGQTRVPR